MGCNTVGFVLTNDKDPFKIYKLIKDAIVSEMKAETGEDMIYRVFQRNKFTSPVCTISDFTEMMNIDFYFNGEFRSMTVHLTCDHNYIEAANGKRIILSLGCYGESERLMKTALNGLSSLGDIYFISNDCADEWQKLEAHANPA